MIRLARILGLVVGVLAWAAAGLAYYANGEIEWRLIAAGVFFAAMPWGIRHPAK